MRVGLVIFDCDGVLVDSEVLAAGVLGQKMAEIGLPITPEIFRHDFLGRSFASAARRCEERFGRPLPPDFEKSYRQTLFETLARDLKPMDGVYAVLDSLTVPYCLATGSHKDRLAVSLKAAGLASRFEGRCFTTSDVAHGKPAPDVFLHAAERMGFAPQDCLVLEDSEMGVRAGLAAGMTVWHFAGGAHMRAGYGLPGDVTPHGRVTSMAELGVTLRARGLCRAAVS